MIDMKIGEEAPAMFTGVGRASPAVAMARAPEIAATSRARTVRTSRIEAFYGRRYPEPEKRVDFGRRSNDQSACGAASAHVFPHDLRNNP